MAQTVFQVVANKEGTTVNFRKSNFQWQIVLSSAESLPDDTILISKTYGVEIVLNNTEFDEQRQQLRATIEGNLAFPVFDVLTNPETETDYVLLRRIALPWEESNE